MGATLLPGVSALADPLVTLQPPGGPDVTAYLGDPATEPHLSAAALQTLLQQKIKYLFVIFNENRSFDSEYGTFPGVNGLYSDGRTARLAPGAVQAYTDLDGRRVTIAPFRIGPAQNAGVVDSVDHSHTGLARKIDAVDGVARMDGFAAQEYTRLAPPGATAAQQAKARQYARLVMAHVDCDTIPFFWRWASNFTIFDNIFATEDTPSTAQRNRPARGSSGRRPSG